MLMNDFLNDLGIPPHDQILPKSATQTESVPVITSSEGPPNPNRVCSDGERTNYLTRLAGSWIRQGIEIQSVKLMALGWNSSNDPPLSNENVTATCDNILKTHQSRNPSGIVAEAATPLFDLGEASVHAMLRNPPPPRRWLLKDCLPYGKVGMIVAPGGTGKSMFALQLVVSLAVGSKFAGHWDIGETGASLVLFGEEDTEEIHRRLYNVVGATVPANPAALAAIDRSVYIKSMIGVDNLMTRNNATGAVLLTDYADRLICDPKK